VTGVALPDSFDRFRPMAIGDGIVLRTVEVDDAAPLAAFVQANREHLLPYLVDLVDEVTDADTARAHLERVVADRGNGSMLEMHIEEHGVLCGSVRLRSLDWHHRSGNIGYLIGATHQGRGLVTRVVGRFVDWVFAELQLHRIELRCASGNTASIAVARRLGFALEGTLRDAERLGDGYIDILVFSRLAPSGCDPRR
jgi:ribosomal-protein-serine acetyltransferase